jgi:hypothetical protein
MAVYGCFRMMIADPDRTWTADYIIAKSEEVIQFWNRSPNGDKPDVLVGIARLGKEQTICDVASTKLNAPKIYRPDLTNQALNLSSAETYEERLDRLRKKAAEANLLPAEIAAVPGCLGRDEKGAGMIKHPKLDEGNPHQEQVV